MSPQKVLCKSGSQRRLFLAARLVAARFLSLCPLQLFVTDAPCEALCHAFFIDTKLFEGVSFNFMGSNFM